MNQNLPFAEPLPIDDALPALTAALAGHDAAVLVAPPGAGKTTRVPLVLIREPWAAGKKILVLEPRRLAARAAAARMAATLGESVGQTVGYRVRFGSKISGKTRIEVVTEGVFTRMILDDPTLEDVAAVLLDEFHERSLDADLGLALARDTQQGFREDLKILVMSATIDGARIAEKLGGAPVVESLGRAFPVETKHFARDSAQRLEPQVADAVLRALRAEKGSMLVFLPGAGEIRRTEALLAEKLADPMVDVVPLYGALDADVQDRAISPAAPGRRKVVLATSIAETSLTIEGVRVVIDSGLARVPRHEPDLALTRLETVRVSRAAADQRRGRAGRTEPGVCWRLWDERETVSLEPFAQAEILAADLSALVLDLAHWGVTDPATLTFLDAPPAPALAEAKVLLQNLGAIDADGRITDAGRRLRALPLPPRLARMVTAAAAFGAAPLGAEIALVLTERGLGGTDIDLRHRLDGLRRDRSRRAEEARRMAARWAEISVAGQRAAGAIAPAGAGRVSAAADRLPGTLLALAYPDRVAKARGGGAGGGSGVLLANGRGAVVDPASPLAREPFLVVADLAGTAAASRVLLAAPIAPEDVEALFAQNVVEGEEVVFDPASASLRARWSRRLGAIALAEKPVPVVPSDETARKLADGIGRLGLDRLPWSPALAQWRDRVTFLRRNEGDDWPDLSDATLGATLGDWLAPALAGRISLGDLGTDAFSNAVRSLLPWNLHKKLEHEAPTHFEAPSGSRVPIEYTEEGPKLSIRVQELFGLAEHPSIAGGRVPLIVELLSPAQRPVQITTDLPAFWQGSYAAVRTEMRGRYPKHPWPEDPTTAPATRRAKPKGT
ncbi:ATP-dependent helicase HrpB [Rhodovulum sp. PH10]|uniref:ATP-dependent helicase HrpB n=1 Tax=Rhodovulum sp. PH10 TaxID=1187851 RepID=UPI00027C2538|nr:ATP-dependent helicase HrpB [Rhodovulum sp. PH10]EJW11328.1 ATP-dependent helicase HrpB [Rhodovulum sp. PH10]